MGQGNAALPADPYGRRALCCLAQRECLFQSLGACLHPSPAASKTLQRLSLLLHCCRVCSECRSPPAASCKEKISGQATCTVWLGVSVRCPLKVVDCRGLREDARMCRPACWARRMCRACW